MKVEMKLDPVEEAVQNGLLMGEHHRVVRSDWVEWLNKQLGREDLFAYFHTGTGNYILAQWLVREPRVCLELEVLPGHPDRGGHLSLEWMRLRCRTAEEIKKEMRKKMAEAKRERRRKQELRGVERQDKAKWLRKRGHYSMAAGVGAGGGAWCGEEEGGDRLEELKDELQRMVKVI